MASGMASSLLLGAGHLHTSAPAPFRRASRIRLNAVAQSRPEDAAPDRRSVLLGLGSMLTAVQASPSLAAKETAQVGDYLPAMPGIDGFVEFIPDRKKVDHPTRSQRLSRLLSNCHNSHDCSQ